MIYFVGAGCGAADLITVRGMRLLEKADVVIYAGSLVNPELLSYTKETPAALVYKASWPEEEAYLCTVETLPQVAKEHQITKTALVLVGDVLANERCTRSKLYAPDFATEFRKKKE